MSMPQEWNSVDEHGTFYTAEQLDAKIHELTARQLLDQLEAGEASPGLLQCALRFLKDNDVTALPIPGSQMERIAGKLNLPFRIHDACDEAESPQPED